MYVNVRHNKGQIEIADIKLNEERRRGLNLPHCAAEIAALHVEFLWFQEGGSTETEPVPFYWPPCTYSERKQTKNVSYLSWFRFENKGHYMTFAANRPTNASRL